MCLTTNREPLSMFLGLRSESSSEPAKQEKVVGRFNIIFSSLYLRNIGEQNDLET